MKYWLLGISVWLLAACATTPATQEATPSAAATMAQPTATPATVPVTVYFTDAERYAAGTEPYEVGVTRQVRATADLPAAVLAEFFKGPTAAEQAQSLTAVTSGATGFSALQIDAKGVARVYLTGACASGGATYTIAQPLMKNLLQFEHISAVKIYDEAGETIDPAGPGNSTPFCLEP